MDRENVNDNLESRLILVIKKTKRAIIGMNFGESELSITLITNEFILNQNFKEY